MYSGLRKELETGKKLCAISAHDQSVNSIAISPDGMTLASGSTSGKVKLWHLNTEKKLLPIPMQKQLVHNKSLNSIAISPDGKTLASASDGGKVKLWDLETKELLLTLCGHSDAVNCVAFGLDEKTLVSGSDDETVKVWRRQASIMSSQIAKS